MLTTRGKEFIKLALIKKEQVSRGEADRFTRLTLQGHIDQILQAKEPIKAEDIFKDENTRLVVVEGAPGIGKSTFVREQCRQWSTGELLQQFSLVLLLSLREEGVQTAMTISDLFHCSDDPELGALVWEEVRKTHGEGVLFVFDGYDEIPNEMRRKKTLVVKMISSSSYLPKATVLVTSRPSVTAELYSCERAVDERIEIVGFSHDEIQEYAEKMFKGELLTSFKEYLSAYPMVRAMMYSPLNCDIIVDVYHDKCESQRPIPHTLTQLYTEMSLCLLVRHMESLSHEELPSSLEGFQQSNIHLYLQLTDLGKLAFDGVENQTMIFRSKEVPESCRDLGLLTSCSELYKGAKNVTFNFFHLTLQEYMAAFYISQLPASKQSKVFVKHRQSRHLDVVWQFVAGLTRMQAIGWEEFRGRKVRVGHREDMGYEAYDGVVKVWPSLLRCMYEAQDSGSCESVIGQSRVLYEGADCSTPFDAYAVGHCVSLCKNRWDVDLSDNNLGLEGVRLLGCGLRSVEDGGGSVEMLSLSRNHITCTGIEELIKFPHQILHQIRKLNLSGCDLEQVGFGLLADNLPLLASLKSLIISHNPGGNGSTVKLLKALGKHSTIEILHMAVIMISTDDVMALSEVVHKSKCLRKLNIGSDNMSPECVPQLVRTVLSSSALRYLTVCVSSSTSPLDHINTINVNLTRLQLESYAPPSQPPSEVRGGIRFSNLLKENKTLKQLLLSIPLGDTEVRAIVDSLKINHTITKLCLSERFHSQYFSESKQQTLDQRIEWLVF